MRRALVAASLLPAILGAALGLALHGEVIPSSLFVFRLQAPASAVAAVAGLLASSALLLLVGVAASLRGAAARARRAERRSQDEVRFRFVRRLNHELKNPLTAIRAGLANLDQPGLPEDARHASASNVHRQVDRLVRLVEDLRKLTDLETSKPEMEVVDLGGVVEEAVELALGVPGREHRRITVLVQKVPWTLAPVEGDRDLLLLAVYNLLDNALKFSDEDAVVEVRAVEDGAQATVEIADTGPGIGAEELPHVTEELYRGSTAQGAEGSGLGLALVDRIAGLHGGQLTIRSRWGLGTAATLRLPLRNR